jgi:hypothetical protein
MARALSAVCAAAIAATASPAPAAADAAADRAALRRIVEKANAAIERAIAASAPPRVPPVPVKVTWRPRRLASVNVGAQLLALVGGDLDADGKAELYAVTEKDVVVYDAAAGKLVERGRAALPADPPALRPRDAVATAYVERGARELRVKTSTRARGARYAVDGKGLRELGTLDEFPLCAGRSAQLVPGRNHFGTVDTPVYAVECRDDLVDREGTPLGVVAELGASGSLAVTVTPRVARAGTPAPASIYTGAAIAVSGVGTAYEVADVDRDGTIEVITSGAGAPGDKDAIKVLAVGAAGVAKKPTFRRAFSGGVVAIVVADVDGDGADEVIGAVRLAGSTKVDLWQLNP